MNPNIPKAYMVDEILKVLNAVIVEDGWIDTDPYDIRQPTQEYRLLRERANTDILGKRVNAMNEEELISMYNLITNIKHANLLPEVQVSILGDLKLELINSGKTTMAIIMQSRKNLDEAIKKHNRVSELREAFNKRLCEMDSPVEFAN